MTIVNHDLSRAIVEWTGRGAAMRPMRHDERVTTGLGPERGAELLAQLDAFKADFYATDAHLTEPTLTAMAARASREFRERHPEISEEAVAALAWCYTYDHK